MGVVGPEDTLPDRMPVIHFFSVAVTESVTVTVTVAETETETGAGAVTVCIVHIMQVLCCFVGARHAVPVKESRFRDCAGLSVLKTGLFYFSILVS